MGLFWELLEVCDYRLPQKRLLIYEKKVDFEGLKTSRATEDAEILNLNQGIQNPFQVLIPSTPLKAVFFNIYKYCFELV